MKNQTVVAHLQSAVMNDLFPESQIERMYYGEGPESINRDKNWLKAFRSLSAKFAEAGLYKIAIPEDCGGNGLSLVEMTKVFECLGGGLLPSRIYSTALASLLLKELPMSPQIKACLQAMGTGEHSMCVGFAANQLWNAAKPTLSAKPVSGGFEIDGAVPFVLDGEYADSYLIPANGSDGRVSFFLLKSDDDGLVYEPKKSIDPLFSIGTLRANKVTVSADRWLNSNGDRDGAEILRSTSVYGTQLFSASLLGSAAKVLDLVVSHTKERHVAGGPIARFQALSHRISNMYINLEKAKSLVYYSAAALDARERADSVLGVYVSMSKTSAERVALDNAQEGIQMHGAAAFQWKHRMNFYFRRGLLGKTLCGPSAAHYDCISELALKKMNTDEVDTILPLASF